MSGTVNQASRRGAHRPIEIEDMDLNLFRPLRLGVVAFLAIVVATIAVIGLLSWQNELRLSELRAHVAGTQRLQTRFQDLERATIDQLAAGRTQAEARARLREELRRLAESGMRMSPESRTRLEDALRALDRPQDGSKGGLGGLLEQVRSIGESESRDRQEILDAMSRDLRTQLRLALAVPVVLLALGGVILWSAQRRVYRPLRRLEALLSQVAEGEFSAVSLTGVEPFLQPLFRNYNGLVNRLRDLEESHRAHAESLEREVRLATGALLEQQQSLARGERLAATGELAASVAHELRNPLAAIQMALRNLRRDVGDPELAHRLGLVSEEVERLSRLLNQMLTLSRHVPEAPREIRLAEVVRQLVELTRYQLPPDTEVDVRIPEDLICRLAPDSLRQALLNLILNASQALPGGAGRIVIQATRSGETLLLTVEDDGPGFDEQMVSQAARPFFSTRDRGTGLGLALVSRFARDAEGSVELSNRESGGARVKLVLPCKVERE